MLVTLAVALYGAYLAHLRRATRRERAALQLLAEGELVLHNTDDWSPFWWPREWEPLHQKPTFVCVRYYELGEWRLAPLEQLSALRGLELIGVPMKDEDFALVAEIRSLKHLHLEDIVISGIGLGHLTRMESLKYLTLESTDVDAEKVRDLQLARPDLTIVRIE